MSKQDSQERLEWIDVRERLPKDSAYVLIALCAHTVFVGRCAFYKQDTRKWQMGTDPKPVLGVTHWMPLPAPPSDSKESQ